MFGVLAQFLSNPKVLQGVGDFVTSALDKISPTVGKIAKGVLSGLGLQDVISVPSQPHAPPANLANSMMDVILPSSRLNKHFIDEGSMQAINNPTIGRQSYESYSSGLPQSREVAPEIRRVYQDSDVVHKSDIEGLRRSRRSSRKKNRRKSKLVSGLY